MKNTLLVIAVLFSDACASTPPTMESVAGVYQGKYEGNTLRVVLQKNGVLWINRNGDKENIGGWKLADNKVYVKDKDENGIVLMIKPNRNLITIFTIKAGVQTGKRHSPHKRITWKKIK